MRSTIIRTGIAIAALAVAAPAAMAATPDIEHLGAEPYSGSFNCGDFVNEWTGTETVTVKTWFDADGEPTRVTFQIRFREIDVNSVTGESVVLRSIDNETYDLIKGTRTVTGAIYIGNQKAAGTYIQDTGRLVEDADGNLVSMAGPHTGYEQGVDDLVCAALD
jgi:hypothetical protein